MKADVKEPIPAYIKNAMPGGITRLNTCGCRYYGIIGLSRRVRGWYMGMFMEYIFPWYKADYILDLDEGVWWWTGRCDEERVRKLEAEHEQKRVRRAA